MVQSVVKILERNESGQKASRKRAENIEPRGGGNGDDGLF